MQRGFHRESATTQRDLPHAFTPRSTGDTHTNESSDEVTCGICEGPAGDARHLFWDKIQQQDRERASQQDQVIDREFGS